MINSAEKDYIGGLTLEAIATKYDRPIGTVKNWHCIRKWASLRRLKKEQELKNLFDDIVTNKNLSLENQIKLSTLLKGVLSEVTQITSDEDPLFVRVKALQSLQLSIESSTRSVKNLVPKADEEMLEELLDAIEKDENGDK